SVNGPGASIWLSSQWSGRGGFEDSATTLWPGVRVAVSPRPSDSLARFLSLVGLPPVLALPTALLAALHAGGSIGTGLSVVAFLVTGCVIPTVLTVLLVRSGRATAFDLRERSERLLPSAVTAGCCAGMAWILSKMGAPVSICNLALAIAIQM